MSEEPTNRCKIYPDLDGVPPYYIDLIEGRVPSDAIPKVPCTAKVLVDTNPWGGGDYPSVSDFPDLLAAVYGGNPAALNAVLAVRGLTHEQLSTGADALSALQMAASSGSLPMAEALFPHALDDGKVQPTQQVRS